MEEIGDLPNSELSPGQPDKCKGAGGHTTATGQPIGVLCDECDFMMDCIESGKWGQEAR